MKYYSHKNSNIQFNKHQEPLKYVLFIISDATSKVIYFTIDGTDIN